MPGILKTISSILFFFIFFTGISFTENSITSFEEWLKSYKANALSKGISQQTIDVAFKNVKFLEKVIGYDRQQPEFFEDTITYVTKRANLLRVKKASNLLKKNEIILTTVENKFKVEKEILLALWGIETNFGKHVGKMDIISSLATLSYDKRRSEFFSKQLFILLKLIDDEKVSPDDLFGSWAGAFGNFQFMPSTIKNYAIDYDGNNKIDLKNSIEDSLASAANYINKIGWKKNEPCFYRVKITNDIEEKYFNSSARNISNRLKISKWKKKGIINYDQSELKGNLLAALIQPDGKRDTPTFLVFGNYERLLKWNRSLRFAISVCTLANKIKT